MYREQMLNEQRKKNTFGRSYQKHKFRDKTLIEEGIISTAKQLTS